MKAVKTHLQSANPDRVAKFEKGAQEFAKKIVGNFKDFEFYVGESMNPDGMVLLLVSIRNTFLSTGLSDLSYLNRTTGRTEQLHTLRCGRMV